MQPHKKTIATPIALSSEKDKQRRKLSLNQKLEHWITETTDPTQISARQTAKDIMMMTYENEETHLELCRMNLTNLPKGAFHFFPNLERLDVSINQLTTLDPETFSGLSKLTDLNLSHNHLAALDSKTLTAQVA